MGIKLGKSKVTTKSDGGITFYPESTTSPNHPIFVIEVPCSCSLLPFLFFLLRQLELYIVIRKYSDL